MKRIALLITVSMVASIGSDSFARADDSLSAQTLELAEEVGAWLSHNAARSPNGIYWPDDVLNPDVASYDLASGTAGKVLFFVALYRATGNTDYLDLAKGGADNLASVIRDPTVFDGNSQKAALYTGVSGIGVALVNVNRHVADDRYSDAIDRVVRLLGSWSVDDAGGLRWSDEFNDLLYGDAGTILFLSWYAERAGNIEALTLAHRGAGFLAGQAISADDGTYWLFRRSKPFNLPNFSHGTAGISFVLATVARLTNDASLVIAAQSGFDYIKSIAEIDGQMLRLPYGWGSDSWDGLFEFGWAHGLAGTTRLFIRLQQTGIDTDSAVLYESLSRHTLQNIGLPGQPVEPFAEPSTPRDFRFGRAAVLGLASDWTTTIAATDDIERLRNALWNDIRQAAIRDSTGAHWETDAPEFMGGGRVAYTGILHGAAGIGLAILRMHARLSGQPPYVDLPDDPAR